MYALVDCNNFYVSCERRFNPKLKDRPVVVLSNNDGCAVSRSNEAKALGIPMGAPIFKFKDIVKKHGVICLSSNYALYGDISRRVMSVFEKWTPDVEVYSIDEAFLRFTGKSATSGLEQVANEIRSTVRQWTGIPVSVGIGATKTLAKAGSKLAKSSESGVMVLSPLSENSPHLERLKIDDVWGVGRKYSQWLHDHGVHTALDLRNADEKWIRQKMTVVGHRTVLELRGTDCIPMELNPPNKKTLCHARSFGKLIESKSEVAESVANYAEQAAFKLRKEGLAAQKICVFMETNPFRTQDPQYRASKTIDFPVPSNFTPEVVKYALEGFEKIFRPGFKYKKAGILLLELVPEGQAQGELFDTVNRERSQSLMKVLDGINGKHGRDALGFAAGHIREGWKPRFEQRSSTSTTQWEGLPVVLA